PPGRSTGTGDRPPRLGAVRPTGGWIRHMTSSVDRGWLRAMPADGGRDALFDRAGHRVYGTRRLSELVQGRPPGVTGSQWGSASRTSFDLVVGDADTGRPVVAVAIGPVPPAGSAEQR